MRRDARAVVFDLDDTLYPYRRFKTSGLLAVAEHLTFCAGIDTRLVFETLMSASRGPGRGHELQACLAQHDLPAHWLPELIEVLRYHIPRLTLPAVSRRTLRVLRDGGWRLGVLTNGPRSIQARKVAALGLEPHVDVVVYASTVGTTGGKPDPETFAHVARQLSVPASRTVFVGDDERCDVEGARGAGMIPVRCVAWTRADQPTAARAVVERLGRVPAVATSLIEEISNRHAA